MGGQAGFLMVSVPQRAWHLLPAPREVFAEQELESVRSIGTVHSMSYFWTSELTEDLRPAVLPIASSRPQPLTLRARQTVALLITS